MKQIYNAVIAGVDGKELDICFPDFPGCVSGGKTVTEALKNGKEALEFHIEGMLQKEEEIPPLSDSAALDELLKESHGEFCRLAVIEAEIPDGTRERINITIPRYVLNKIDTFAKRHNRTRSAMFAEASMEYIDTHK